MGKFVTELKHLSDHQRVKTRELQGHSRWVLTRGLKSHAPTYKILQGPNGALIMHGWVMTKQGACQGMCLEDCAERRYKRNTK